MALFNSVIAALLDAPAVFGGYTWIAFHGEASFDVYTSS